MKENKLTEQQKERINDILTREGFSQEQKDVILSSFKEFGNHYEFYKNNTNYSNVLNNLSNDKNPSMPIYQQLKMAYEAEELQKFCSLLKQKNLTLPDAISLNYYSNNILVSQIKRMETAKKNSYLPFIKKDLFEKFDFDEIATKKLNDFLNYIHSLDCNSPEYFKKVVVTASNDEFINKYTEEINLYAANYRFYYNALHAIKKLDVALKNQIPYNIVVYRGIKKEDLANLLNKHKYFFENKNSSSIVGEKISDDGYTSTSLRYDVCFANRAFKTLCLRILVPKGTQGVDISNFSSYGFEEEVLFNSNDLFLIDYKYNTDLNQHFFTAFMLSKDRECYKNIAPKLNLENDEEENE